MAAVEVATGVTSSPFSASSSSSSSSTSSFHIQTNEQVLTSSLDDRQLVIDAPHPPPHSQSSLRRLIEEIEEEEEDETTLDDDGTRPLLSGTNIEEEEEEDRALEAVDDIVEEDEETGGRGVGVGRGGNQQGGGGGGGDASTADVSLWPGGQRSYRAWKAVSWTYMAYLACMAVALTAALIVNGSNTCERPLRMWAVVAAIIFYLQLAKSAWLHRRLPVYLVVVSQNTRPNIRRYEMAIVYGFNRIMNLVWVIWFFLGTYYVFDEKDCPSQSPVLWRTCFAELIIQLILIGLVIGLVVLGVLIGGIIICINPQLLGVKRPKGATPKLIDRMTTKFSWNSQEQNGIVPEDDAFCAICLSEYRDGEVLRRLRCGHHYHAECVESWLKTNKSCATCRRLIDTPIQEVPKENAV
jgi:hypothetical protein